VVAGSGSTTGEGRSQMRWVRENEGERLAVRGGVTARATCRAKGRRSQSRQYRLPGVSKFGGESGNSLRGNYGCLCQNKNTLKPPQQQKREKNKVDRQTVTGGTWEMVKFRL